LQHRDVDVSAVQPRAPGARDRYAGRRGTGPRAGATDGIIGMRVATIVVDDGASGAR
jgi:hypothetical protein